MACIKVILCVYFFAKGESGPHWNAMSFVHERVGISGVVLLYFIVFSVACTTVIICVCFLFKGHWNPRDFFISFPRFEL
jgi:hypothetical protein